MDTFLMAAMLTVGLLPYLTVCDWFESGATASDCSVAMLSFTRRFMQGDIVMVSFLVGVNGNAENSEEKRDQNIQDLFHDGIPLICAGRNF